MGFLYEIISEVKENSNLSPYKNTLENAVTKLNENLNKGKIGLEAVIDPVKQGIERWLGEVEKKNNEVKNPILELLKNGDNDNNKIPKLIETIKRMNGVEFNDGVVSSLFQWLDHVQRLLPLCTKSCDAIKTLDKNLKSKLEQHVNRIQQAAEGYSENAVTDVYGLQRVCWNVDSEFQSLNEMVDNRINDNETGLMRFLTNEEKRLEESIQDEIQKVRNTLFAQFSDILQKIGDLESEKKVRFVGIRKTLHDAQNLVDKDFDPSYRKQICGCLNDVKMLIKNFADEKSTIATQFSIVQSKVRGIEEDVRNGLTKLRTQISVLTKQITDSKDTNESTGLIGKQLKALEDAKQKLAGETTSPILSKTGHLKNLYRRCFRSQFENLAQALQDAKLSGFKDSLSKHSTSLNEQLKKLEKIGKISDPTSQQPFTSRNTQDVTQLVEELNNAIRTVTDRYKSVTAPGSGGVVTNARQLKSAVEQAGTSINALSEELTRAISEAHKYVESSSNDPALKTAVSKLETLVALKDAVYGNGGTASKPKQDSLAQLIEDVDTEMSAVNPAIYTFRDIADNLIRGAAEAAVNASLERFEMRKNSRTDIDVAKMMQIFNISKNEIQEAVNIIDSEIAELKKVPGFVDGEIKKTDDSMEQLKGRIHGEIYLIGVAVRETDDALTAGIKSLAATYHEAYTNVEHAVSEFVSQLLADLQNALIASKQAAQEVHEAYMSASATSQNNIKKSALSHFAKSKAFALQKLQALVERENAKIGEIIAKDLESGLKGMMKQMNGQKGTLDTISGLVTPPAPGGKTAAQIFRDISTNLKSYYQAIHDHIDGQVNPQSKLSPKPPTNQSPTDPANQLTKIKSDFDNLLGHLQKNTKKYNYDNEFVKLRDHLTSSLTALSPSAFANPRHPELLDAVRSGLQGLVKEMERVYVNGYDDGTLINFTLNPLVKNDAGKNSGQNEKLTPYGEKLSKVCLTVVSNLHIAFKVLKKYCYTEQRFQKINKNTDVGMFFYHQGYDVSVKEKQKGELDKNVAATKIKKLLISDDYKHIYHTDKDTKLALQMLNEHLNDYYQVCHVSTFAAKKRPCNVFEILCWLSGLPCSSVYEEVLRDAVSELFEDPNKQVAADLDGFEITVTDMRDDFLPAHPNNMLYDDTRKAVMRLCSKSYDVLTRIVGYGNAHTMYAVDYCANSLNFHYPSKGEDCLQMLLDVLSRLYPPLRF
ncbi:hypothetical protein, conserved, partial [Babesia bigemina]